MVVTQPASRVERAQICLLYSGLFLNVAFLQVVGGYYHLVHNPVQLCLVLTICGSILLAGVYYVPARLGSERGYDLPETVRLYLGSTVSAFVKYILIPAWAVSCFLHVGLIVSGLLDMSLFHSETPRLQPGAARNVLAGSLCFAVIVSAVKESRSQLARSASLLAKASIAIIAGLALSTARWWPEVTQSLTMQELDVPASLHAHTMLWAAPPLMLAGAFTSGIEPQTRRSTATTGFIILAALVFAVLAAMLTLAAASVPSVRFRKVPDYILYAYLRPHQLGWVKVLLLSLTGILSARFLAHFVVRSIRPHPGWLLTGTVTSAMLLAVFATPAPWTYLLWERAAIPFPPLGAVLAAAYWADTTSKPLRCRDQAAAAAAWSTGCVVGSLPLWLPSAEEYFNSRSPVAILSWVISFTIALAYFRIRNRTQ